jgi:hypothetical protein
MSLSWVKPRSCRKDFGEDVFVQSILFSIVSLFILGFLVLVASQPRSQGEAKDLCDHVTSTPTRTMPTTKAKRNNKQATTELKNWLLDEENQPSSYYPPSLGSVDEASPSSIVARDVSYPKFLKSRVVIRTLRFSIIFMSGVFFAL